MAIPKFLNALYRILSDDHQGIIQWCRDGKAFEIRDVTRLELFILPAYFKHNKLASFQRQLNYFGFRKWTKTETNVCTFSHQYFLRGKAENLLLITKKAQVPTDRPVLGKRIQGISSSLAKPKKTLKYDFESFPFSNNSYDQLVEVLLADPYVFDIVDFDF